MGYFTRRSSSRTEYCNLPADGDLSKYNELLISVQNPVHRLLPRLAGTFMLQPPQRQSLEDRTRTWTAASGVPVRTRRPDGAGPTHLGGEGARSGSHTVATDDRPTRLGTTASIGTATLGGSWVGARQRRRVLKRQLRSSLSLRHSGTGVQGPGFPTTPPRTSIRRILGGRAFRVLPPVPCTATIQSCATNDGANRPIQHRWGTASVPCQSQTVSGRPSAHREQIPAISLISMVVLLQTAHSLTMSKPECKKRIKNDPKERVRRTSYEGGCMVK